MRVLIAAAIIVTGLALPRAATAGDRDPWSIDIPPSPWTGESVDSFVTRDKLGRSTGSLTRDLDGDYTIRDSLGRATGLITKDPVGDDWSIRDSIGRRSGTLDRR